jgi:hypothetical protein
MNFDNSDLIVSIEYLMLVKSKCGVQKFKFFNFLIKAYLKCTAEFNKATQNCQVQLRRTLNAPHKLCGAIQR